MKNKISGIQESLKRNKNFYTIIEKYFSSLKLFLKDVFKTKNNEGRNTSTIIWAIILIGIVVSLGTLKLVSIYLEKVNSRQISLINAINGKFNEFSIENVQIIDTKQSFIEVIKYKKFNKTNEVLSKLLNEAQAIRPRIDSLKILVQQDINISKKVRNENIFNDYSRAIDLLDRENKKLIEMITLGLTMNWKNPTEAQTTKWKSLATELGSIENEVKNTHIEIQKYFQ